MNDPDYSKLRALKLIRREGALSRVQLAERLDFNRATVTELAAELVRRGLLVEERSAASGRGRPRTHLSIDAGAGYAISLFPLMDGRATVDIIDLKGARIHSHEVTTGPLDDMAALPHLMVDAFEAMLAERVVPRELVRHAAIILPGLVNHRDGIAHWLPSSRVRHDLPLAALVADRIGIPVSLDNRAAAIARAEHWFGTETEGQLDDFTLVALLEVGMNASRYAGGRMQVGYNGMNSEFSHVKVAFEGGRPCYCGSSGCLTTYASVSGIASEFARIGNLSPSSAAGLQQLFDEAVRLADATDVQGLFDTAGKALGTAVSNHVNENDPGRVVITCARSDLLRLIAEPFRRAVDSRILSPIRARTRIDLRLLEEDDYRKGTAALALEGLYREDASGTPARS
nr:ROK family transcriptional regulator [Sphingobium sp. BHU LFT2]